MKILFVSPEVSPLVRTGGLGDVVGSLPLALKQLGIDVRIVCPLHKECLKIPQKTFRKSVKCNLANKIFTFSVSEAQIPGTEIPVYFIGNRTLFEREGIYADKGGDYNDNALRAFALSQTAIHLEKSTGWKPDVFHAHDWMAAPTCAYLNDFRDKLKRKTGSLLTIHNLEHQGCFEYNDFLDSNLPKSYWGIEGFEHLGRLNLLKGGIQHADKLTTVSPTYAEEIKTIQFGEGLEKSLQYRAADLIGILNGIDEISWDPVVDQAIHAPITSSTPEEGKAQCKYHLQNEVQLERKADTPLFGVVSRLYRQKGLDLLIDALPSLLGEVSCQFVILGSGDSSQEKAFSDLSKKWSGRLSVTIGFNDGLARRIFAGSDFFLMPSRFEPCGLAQQYAMKYGSIPIGRKTGGLADTIVSLKDKPEEANGLLFEKPNQKDLLHVIHNAILLFSEKNNFQKIRKNAMHTSFSWESAAKKFVDAYRWSLQN